METNIWQTEPFIHLKSAQTRALRRDPGAFDELVEFLRSPLPYVRHGAAVSLGSLHDMRAIEYLVPLLADSAYIGEGTPIIGNPDDDRFSVACGSSQGQFYVGDSRFDGDTASPDFWSEEAFARRLAISPPSLLGIATNREFDLPVIVKVHKMPPEDRDDLGTWDHIVEASLEVPSGRAAIDGCLSYRPEASPLCRADDPVSPHISVWPGTYRVRICTAALGTEEDHYRITLWPAPYGEPSVLRDWPGSS